MNNKLPDIRKFLFSKFKFRLDLEILNKYNIPWIVKKIIIIQKIKADNDFVVLAKPLNLSTSKYEPFWLKFTIQMNEKPK